MKIRNNTRIMSLVLALVMLLPLISIPAFAEESSTAFSENFDGKTLTDATAGRPASAKITPAVADAATHGDVLQLDVKGMNTAAYYLWQDTNHKWPITGEVVDGKISGTANSLTVPATDVPENDDDTTKKVTIGDTTYTVVTGVYADSMGGFTNVAQPVTFKNTAFYSADASFVAIEMDVYLSEDFKNESDVSGRISSSAGNVELFAITAVNGANPKIANHENGKITSGAAAALSKGEWNTLLFIIKMSTAEIEVYVNGEFAFKETNRTALNQAVDLNANGLQVQIDRAYAPSTNAGYVQFDNLLMTSDLSDVEFGGTLYSQDFNSATDKSEVLTSNATAGLASIQAAAVDASAHGNVYHAPAQPGGEGYYIMSGQNTSSQLTSYEIDEDGLISGTAANGTKIKNSVINESRNNAAVTNYGTKARLEDGTESTWYVVEAIYRNAWQGSFNIAGQGGQLKNPAVNAPFTGTVMLSASYYFSADASFGNQGRLYAYRGSDNANKAYDLFQMNAANGKVTITNHSDAIASRTDGVAANKTGSDVTVPAGQWFTVDMVINFATAKMDLYVDGYLAFSLTDTDFAGGINSIIADKWSVTMFSRGYAALKNTGYCDVDNVSITFGNAMPEVDSTAYLYRNDFEYQTVGAAPTGLGTVAVSDSKISDAYGSKAWEISYDYSKTYNSDKNNKIANPALSYENYDSIVIQADYYITPNSVGRIQSQGYQIKANGTVIGNGWNDLYQVDFTDADGAVILKREGGTDDGYAYLTRGNWYTVSAVINLNSGNLDIYLDGELVIDSTIAIGNDSYENLTIDANQIILAKTNKVGTASTFLVDNIAVYIGATPNVAPSAENISAFKDLIVWNAIPELLSYKKLSDGNGALRLDMGAAASADTYWAITEDCKTRLATDISYTFGDAKVTISGVEYDTNLDEEKNLYTITKDNVVYYLLPGDLAEAAYSGDNVGKALQINHDDFAYEAGKKVMLEANYFIEEGSTGVVESQFQGFTCAEGKSGWVQLFTINMENGRFDNSTMYMNVGAWNNVKVIIDLASGNYDMYVNDVWAKKENFGDAVSDIDAATEVSITSDWIIAKVQRHTTLGKAAYTGGLYIDDINVTDVAVTSTSTVSNKFLSDDAYNAFVADILTAVNGASIRLADPTGLRFASAVNTQKLAHLKAMGATVGKQGTIITPASYVEAAGEFSFEALDQLNVSVAYLDVEFDGDYFDGDAGFDASGANYMVGSIVNILDKNITREFAGAAYIRYTIDGTTYTVYADAQVRSVRNVADAAKADQNAHWTDAQLDVLNKYATPEA